MKPARRYWLVGAAMLGCAALAQMLRPKAVADRSFDLQALIPNQFENWRIDPSVVPIAPSPDVQANLDQLYDQIVSRTYVGDSGQRMMLVVAYGGDQSDSLKAHRQEVCYAAQGFAIRSVRDDVMQVDGAGVPLVRVHAVKGRRSEPVSYWFTMGDRVALGRAERLVTQIGYGLAGRIPDGLLMRVSNISGDTDSSFRAHDEFLRALLSSVGADARMRLAGLSGRSDT
jgi:EpsI family protein